MKPCDVSSQRTVISLRDFVKMSSVFVFAHTFAESMPLLRWLGVPRLEYALPCGDGPDFVALLDFTAKLVGVGERPHSAGLYCVGTALAIHSPEIPLDRETFLEGVSDSTIFRAPGVFESVDFTFASTSDQGFIDVPNVCDSTVFFAPSVLESVDFTFVSASDQGFLDVPNVCDSTVFFATSVLESVDFTFVSASDQGFLDVPNVCDSTVFVAPGVFESVDFTFVSASDQAYPDVPNVCDSTVFLAPGVFESVDLTFASTSDQGFLDVPNVCDSTVFLAPGVFESVDFTFTSTGDQRLSPVFRPLRTTTAVLLSTTILLFSRLSCPDFATVVAAVPDPLRDRTLQLAISPWHFFSKIASFSVFASSFFFFFLVCASVMDLGKKGRETFSTFPSFFVFESSFFFSLFCALFTDFTKKLTGFHRAFSPLTAGTSWLGDPSGVVAAYKD